MTNKAMTAVDIDVNNARATLALLERVQISGVEVAPFMAIQQWLHAMTVPSSPAVKAEVEQEEGIEDVD